MTRKCLRGAILGFGNVAVHAHLPAWRADPRFKIEAVLEPHSVRAKLAKDFLPGARVYSRIEPLLAENELDFVDICTPPCFHEELILQACRHGLHVFCEKPLVSSPERLPEIERAAKDFGRVVFTVNNWKYAPLWTKARELVYSNRIGAVRSLSLSVLRPSQSGGGVSDWRRSAEVAGGGILFDHGWHQIYLLLSMTRESPRSISARLDWAPGPGPLLEETVDLTMQFEGGEAKLHLTWRASARRNEGFIRGDAGALFINDDHMILSADDHPSVRYDFPEALSGGSHHPEWMKPVIEGFLHEVLDAAARGTNLAEARWCSELTRLAYQSDRERSRLIPVVQPTTFESDSKPE